MQLNITLQISRSIGVLICLCILFSLPSYGQQQDPIDGLRIGSQSPTAASLGKFGDVPVSLYTGTPEIEIPLFKLEGESVSLPIKLKYHASGIKVGQIPGWVGLGWALDAGGTITRTMHNRPDEGPNGYYHIGSAFSDNDVWVNPYLDKTLKDLITSGSADTEPDRFFFSVAGRSGRFVVPPEGTGKVRPIPYQRIDIETPWSSGENSWIITTEDGTRYVFTNNSNYAERTIQVGQGIAVDDLDYRSSWKLSRIESPGGEKEVSFQYTPNSVSHQRPVVQTKRTPLTPQTCDLSDHRSSSIYGTTSQMLTTIETDKYKITFSMSDRQDLIGREGGRHKKLDSLSIFSKPGGNLIRKYAFSYFIASDRLFLKSVEEIGAGGQGGSKHNFTYNKPGQLPSRLSNSRDHWGYYNGAPNTDGLIPSYKDYPGDGADRSANPNTSTIGMLTRIDYPTGGHIEFDFETHKYSQIGSSDPYVRVDKQRKFNTTVPPPDSIHFTTGNVDKDKGAIMDLNSFPDCRGCEAILSLRNNSTGETFNFERKGEYNIESPDDSTSYTISGAGIGGEEISTVFKWRELEDDGSNKNGTPAGGVRINRIKKFDGTSSSPVVKNYRYRLDSQGKGDVSSGYIPKEPNYHVKLFAPNIETNSTCKWMSLSTRTSTPLGMTQGSPVGYSQVTVSYGQEGKKRYWFRSFKDYQLLDHDGAVATEYYVRQQDSDPVDGTLGFGPLTSIDWERGQKKKTLTFDNDGNRLRKTSTSYSVDNNIYTNGVKGLSIKTLLVELVDLTCKNPPCWKAIKVFNWKRFRVLTGWVHPVSKRTVVYDSSTGDSTATMKDLNFVTNSSNPSFTQLRSKTENTSNASARTTRYKYAHEQHPDMGPDGTHQLSQKYRTTVFKDADGDGQVDDSETVLKRSWTTWDNRDLDGDLVQEAWVPEDEWVWKGKLTP